MLRIVNDPDIPTVFASNSAMNSAHVPIQRTILFLINGTPLTHEECSHILECEDCRHEMVYEAAKELQRRQHARTSADDRDTDEPEPSA